MNKSIVPQAGDAVITRTGKTGVVKEEDRGVALVLLDDFYSPATGCVRSLEILVDTRELRRDATNRG